MKIRKLDVYCNLSNVTRAYYHHSDAGRGSMMKSQRYLQIKHAFLYVDQPVTYELSKVDTGSSIST